MYEYHIEHEIITLLDNVYFQEQEIIREFVIDGISFSPFEWTLQKGFKSNKWLAKTNIQAKNFRQAIQKYYSNISKITSKISFIGQAYIDIQKGSIAVKNDKYIYFKYIFNDSPVGLHFGKKQQNILKFLHNSETLPQSFYFYWNDVINTTGYSSKILLLCSAMDSLFERNERKEGRLKILGKELNDILYASGDKGLRHRLTHGEYFFATDFNKNYVEEIHKKIIDYFNNDILRSDLKISNHIVNPQRHKDENYKYFGAIYEVSNPEIGLKDILFQVESKEKDSNILNLNGLILSNITDF